MNVKLYTPEKEYTPSDTPNPNAGTLPIYLPKETEEQLYSLFVDIAKKAIKHASKELYSPSERYVTQDKLCKLFRIGPKQVETWVIKGLPRVKFGQRVRYDLQDVYRILEEEKI